MIAPTFAVVDVPQRSPEWFAARAGRVTGSVAADLCATLKKSGKGEAASRRNLRVRLALERVIGRPLENGFQSAAMATGVEREPLALLAYEQATRHQVKACGFLAHTDLPIGASPDGIVGDWEGAVEVKCCQPPAHLDFLRATDPPDGYLKQCVHLLLLTGLPWVDLVYWSPDFREDQQLKIMRINADAAQLTAYELVLRQFLDEVSAEEASIRALRVARPEAVAAHV